MKKHDKSYAMRGKDMFSQYFGTYLLEQELLTPKELRHVLNRKNNLHMPLGTLGMQKKYLAPEQLKFIHGLQENSDLKFGELAVLHGFLTYEQLQELLKLQKNEHYLISQILVEEGYFTISQINTIMDNYRAGLGLSKYEFEALKNNEIEKVVEVFAKLDNICDSTVFNDYISLFVRNVVRFIDNGIILGEAVEIREYHYRWKIFQHISGEMELFTGYASDDEGILELGCRFAHKAVNKINDYILSSAGEFINLQNGLFLSRLSEEGVEPDLQAQEWKRDGVLVASGTMIKIPVQLSFGKFDFFLSEKLPQLWDKEEIMTAASVGRGV